MNTREIPFPFRLLSVCHGVTCERIVIFVSVTTPWYSLTFSVKDELTYSTTKNIICYKKNTIRNRSFYGINKADIDNFKSDALQ